MSALSPLTLTGGGTGPRSVHRAQERAPAYTRGTAARLMHTYAHVYTQ